MIGGVIFLITTTLAQAQYLSCKPDGSCNTGYVCQSAGHTGNGGLCVPDDGRVYLRGATRPTSGGGFSGFFGAIAAAAKSLIAPAVAPTPAPAYIPIRQARPATIATDRATIPCTSEKSGGNGGSTGWALTRSYFFEGSACCLNPNDVRCTPATAC